MRRGGITRILGPVLSATLLASACGSPARTSSDPLAMPNGPSRTAVAAAPSPSRTPAATATPSATPTPSASPSVAATEQPRSCATSASATGSVAQAQIVDVRIGTHDGYDRVVFEFTGRMGPAGVPAYAIDIADRPLYQDPSGLPLTVAGDPVLRVTLRGGTKAPLEGGTPTYSGRTTFVTDFPILSELTEGGDFEAVATWYAGLNGEGCLRVFTLANPARLVIDLSRP